jgi:hypothetical protein
VGVLAEQHRHDLHDRRLRRRRASRRCTWSAAWAWTSWRSRRRSRCTSSALIARGHVCSRWGSRCSSGTSSATASLALRPLEHLERPPDPRITRKCPPRKHFEGSRHERPRRDPTPVGNTSAPCSSTRSARGCRCSSRARRDAGKSRLVEHMAAQAGAAAGHRLLPRRHERVDLLGRWLLHGGRDRVAGRARDPGGADRAPSCTWTRSPKRDRRHRRHPPAGRPPPAARTSTATTRCSRRARVPARRELQPRLPARAQGTQAVDPSALRIVVPRLPRSPDLEERSWSASRAVDRAWRAAGRAGRQASRGRRPRLAEVPSTRLLVHAARLIESGPPTASGLRRGHRARPSPTRWSCSRRSVTSSPWCSDASPR